MLKSLCWTINGGSKEVSYQSTSDKLKEESLPTSFKTNVSVVLIFNKIPQDFKAIVNRAVTLNFDFSFDEKLKIFEEFKDKAKLEDEVLDYVKTNCSSATKNLSIRSLVILSNLKRNGYNFSDFAEEILTCDEDERLLFDCLKNSKTMKEAQIKWCEKTGRSRAGFFRYKRKSQKSQKSQVSRGTLSETKFNNNLKGGIK